MPWFSLPPPPNFPPQVPAVTWVYGWRGEGGEYKVPMPTLPPTNSSKKHPISPPPPPVLFVGFSHEAGWTHCKQYRWGKGLGGLAAPFPNLTSLPPRRAPPRMWGRPVTPSLWGGGRVGVGSGYCFVPQPMADTVKSRGLEEGGRNPKKF